ncbi:HERC1 [Symbiodinium sp. CCMP2592]|nr:HERC1 [Symbiodinium sp. CCMP2592]
MAMIGLVSLCLMPLLQAQQAQHLRGPGPETAKALDRAACQVSEQIRGLRNLALGFLGMEDGSTGAEDDAVQSLLSALEANEKRFCSRLGAGAPLAAESGLVAAEGAATLDLAGMAELMLQVQEECVAQIHAHQAVLEASAASLASCAVARDAANTSALEVAAAQDKALHGACRDSEHEAFVEQGAKYKELSASWANLSTPSCSADMAATDPWQSRVECFSELQAWLQAGADKIESQLQAWIGSLGVEHNQTSLCHGLQTRFEESFCLWTETQDATCDVYKGCFGDASAHHLDVISPEAEAAESSSKADFTAAAHILCKLNVLNASDLVQKQEALQRCEEQIVSTGHLNLSYPELVTEDPCLVPQVYPCMAEWSDSYANQSWYGSLELNTCNPCRTSTTSTSKQRLPSVHGGGHHTLIVDRDGAAWHFGQNSRGERGDGTHANSGRQWAPFKVMTEVRTAEGAGWSSFLVKEDGTAWGTGYNEKGTLGDGSGTDRYIPVQIMTDVAAISCMHTHTAVLKTDGTAWMTGSNSNGELCDGTTTTRLTPYLAMSDVKEATVGFTHTMFLKTDGTVWGCGKNDKGQLGDGTTTTRKSPVQVMTDVHHVVAGDSLTWFMKNDGTCWVVGWNDNGQHGDGTTTSKTTPVQVMSNVKDIGPNRRSTMFLKLDGTVWSVGYNAEGHLGDGTRTSRLTPVQIMNNVTSLSSAWWHTLFVKNDGSVWVTGQAYTNSPEPYPHKDFS